MATKFAIPASMSPEKANELLSKAVHLSEGEREQIMREYLEARGEAAEKPEYEKNTNPAIALAGGAGIDQAKLLADVAAGEIKPDEAAKLLAQPTGKVYAKVSQKGAFSVYGLQRMPVTLYVEQWERLLSLADSIRKALSDHSAQLKRKAA